MSTIEEGLTAVSTGQVDVLLSTLAHSIYEISKMELNNVRIVGKTEFTNDLAFAVQKKLAPLIPLLNRAIDAISEADKRSISNAWGEEKYQEIIDYDLIMKLSAFSFIIIGLVVFWNRKLTMEIDERKKVEAKLKIASTVYQNTNQAIMVTDQSNLIVAINPSFSDLTGYALEDVQGESPAILQSSGNDQNLYVQMWKNVETEGCWHGELWNEKKNGDEYASLLTINTIVNDDKGELQRLWLFSNITEKKLADEKIWEQANFDLLTKLPNRNMFADRLSQEIKVSQRTKKSLALMFLDLDHFKEVNDALGHDKGDQLLIEAAKRIKDCVRESDSVSRLGGDEFTIILTELDDTLHVERIAHNIILNLSKPFALNVETAYVTASIGIALYPDDADEFEKLIKYADQAMYLAKDKGRNQFSFFTQSMQISAYYRHQLLQDLRSALTENQLCLYYQPIINFKSGKIVKAEALLRWIHPSRGMVSPVEFIPLAEESGLIIEIGNWVFHQVIQQLKSWQQDHQLDLQVSINKSPIQFRSAVAYLEWIECLKSLDMNGNCLVVEITERLLIDNSEAVRNELLGFRDKGIQVAIDDFGTGYSALAYLNKFDIDFLKIDRSFISNLLPESNELALCEAIIVMAHKLGLEVIAEGIETKQQQQLLVKAGCDYGQGFLYSMPVGVKSFEKLLVQNKVV